MRKLDHGAIAWLAASAIALPLTWIAATEWPDQAQAVASMAVGLAVVAVTWLYTRHTADMVKAMWTENESSAARHEQLRDEANRRDQIARIAAARSMATELRELANYLNELTPPDQGGGTRPPYPELQLLSLSNYASHMATMPNECNSAVLGVHYQLVAANARAEGDGYWKRAGSLRERIPTAADLLEQVFADATWP